MALFFEELKLTKNHSGILDARQQKNLTHTNFVSFTPN